MARKRRIRLAAAAGGALAVALCTWLLLQGPSASQPGAVTAYFDLPRPLAIAHQGGDGLRPSNTLPAFQHAVELGVDVLELDVHQSRDGAFVVMHDATVDRTTDGRGALAELTLEQIRVLDAAYHWPYQDGPRPYRGLGIRVPTLEEVTSLAPALRFNVEIKPAAAAVGRALCGELERLAITQRVLVASFHPESLDAFRGACPTVPTSAYESEVRRLYLQYRLGLWRWARPTMAALQLPPRSGGFDLTDPGFLAAARRLGIHVDFWTVNDPDEMRALLQRGAAGIITDRPDLLLEVIDRL